MSHYKQQLFHFSLSQNLRDVLKSLEKDVFKTTRIYKETQKLCENMSFDLIKMHDWILTKNMS